MNIVYGTPYLPPAPPAPAFSGLGLRWTAKGSEWALTDPSTGLFLKPGIRGLGSAAYTRHATESPAVAGSRFEGASYQDREVFWPIHIYSDAGSTDWMLRDRAFWATMDPTDTGIWTVTHPDGSHRSLRLRFLNDGDKVRDRDPMKVGWDSYGITLIAEQPFWVGDPVVKSFIGQVPPDPFFGTDGPVVTIASSYSAANATMDNPGDVESYPRWFVDGETTAVSVGVDGVIVTVPFTVAAGQCLVIESDPDLIGATLYEVTPDAPSKPSERVVGVHLINPVDMSPALGEADFAPIPSGSQVPLSMEIMGPGKVEALLPTLYRRPW
ncbi:hypothetical protein [Pseudarthrobacter sp. NamE5]|uniref:hypothetical protein n=1 Tax=Pseudarthrobacter sp. NamE5 TaxID=2576839 RepID=UPI00110AF6C2|nr:hypothetical protein [Pseudarthrobacter sp. NamE5]TLM87207.1 hypothetical protein FDW84_05270 [Pseudarthrobacter sp. NamE5]